MRSILSRAVSFAHLLGPVAKATESGEEEARRAEEEKEKDEARRAKRAKKADDDKKDPDDKGADDDGDDAGMEDEAEEEKDPDDKGAEGDEDDVSAAEDDEIEDGDDKDKAKGKRSAAFRAGRLAERARCARIFGSAAAANRPDLAAHLACNTGLSSAAAIDALKAAGPIGRGSSLHQRMSQTPPPPNPGATAAPDRGGMTLSDKMAAVRKKIDGKA